MISIDKAVIVEGKYDKITLKNIIDATIITTDGFRIFKDKEKCALIKRIAKTRGIVVLTDSDNAGNQIRAKLKEVCCDGEIINAYIPQIVGKERRKTQKSSAGTLGVEGMSEEIILKALGDSGVFVKKELSEKFTKQDMYKYGISGKENSSLLRENLAEFLKLPKGMSSSAFLDAVNAVYSYDETVKEIEKWQHATDKK